MVLLAGIALRLPVAIPWAVVLAAVDYVVGAQQQIMQLRLRKWLAGSGAE